MPGRGTAAAVLLAGSVLLAGCSGATGPATKVTATSATFTALGSCDGGSPTPCLWRWRYRPVGTTAWYADAGCAGRSAGAPARLLRQTVSGLRPGTLYEVQFGGQGDRIRRFTYRGPSVRFRTAAPSNVHDPSGETMPVGNLPGWRQVFADDFRTAVPLGRFPAAVAQRWWAYPTSYHDTSNHGTYDPGRTTRISGGLLRIHLHTAGGRARVSAPVPRIPGTARRSNGSPGGLRYGRYSVRFRADPVAGYKTAWLLWPDSGRWPADGEIDFPEGNLNSTIGAYLHHAGRVARRRPGRLPRRQHLRRVAHRHDRVDARPRPVLPRPPPRRRHEEPRAQHADALGAADGDPAQRRGSARLGGRRRARRLGDGLPPIAPHRPLSGRVRRR